MLKPILIAGVLGALCSPQAVSAYDPEGFNDCVLEFVSIARSDFAADELLRACARKHETDLSGQSKYSSDAPPVVAEPDETDDSVAATWRQVASSEDFLLADRDTRDLLRRKFLEWVIIPDMTEDQREMLGEEVRAMFMDRTEPDLDRNAFDAFDEPSSGPWEKYQ
ncbi:hypothetical protein [Halomonas sp. H2]|uniref:hypothetical protein n=1 Tax=unclassified Halomonas TaxID=2609666 RepID=UPI003CF672CD